MVLFTKTETAASTNNQRRLAWCLPLGALCLAVAGVMLAVDPVLIITSYRMQVSEGSAVHKFLTKPLYPVEVSVYLFNITNAARFEAGEDRKLKVDQVGPFTYKETRFHDNFEIDLDAGVMRYDSRSRVEFLPERSAASDDDVSLTLPNLAMLGVTTAVSSQDYWVRLGFNMLVKQLNSQPMVTVSASAYLWGYSDPLLTLAHTVVPGYVNFKKIGFLDRFFDTSSSYHLEISAKNEDKFMIKTRNGQKKLPMGQLKNLDDCKFCDDFVNAYEGLGYPSPISPETPIRIFKNGLCKILPTEFHKKVVYDNGVEGLVFNLSESFFSLDGNITKNKLLDLRDCFYGIPLAVSKAHFLEVDPELYERIEGVPEPDPTKQSYFVIEPMIAVSLESEVIVQLNLVLPDLSFNSRASSYSKLVIPVAYMEYIQPPLPDDTKQALHLMYVIAPVILQVMVVFYIIAGLALFSYPVIMYFINKPLKSQKGIVLSTQEPLLQSQVQNNGHKQSLSAA